MAIASNLLKVGCIATLFLLLAFHSATASQLANKKLLDAINSFDREAVSQSIELGADLNSYNLDGHGRSPVEVLSMHFLSYSYFPDIYKENAYDFTKFLLDAGLKISRADKVLFFPISDGNIDLVKLLVSNGANVNLKIENYTPHEIATKYNQEEIAAYLETVGAIKTSNRDALQLKFVEAVSNKNIDEAKLLIGKGAKINLPASNGETALVAILRQGVYRKDSFDMVKLLLENGADPNVYGDAGFGKSLEGIPLHLLVYMSAASMSNSKLKDEKKRKLAYEYSVKTFQLLLNKGAHVSAKDTSGRTPIHIAAEKNNLKAAQLLIKNGSKIMARDNDNKTPLDYAESGEMIQLLKKNGAVEN